MGHLPDFSALRSDFPMLSQKMHGKPLVYLDTAATAQKPQVVIDTIKNFYERQYGTVHRAVYEIAGIATAAYQQVRHKTQKFLNASLPEEIIFTRGTTESINLVAHSFGKAFVKPGDEIIISAMEHHSNLVPWQMLCENHGATLKVIPLDEQGKLSLDVYATLLTPRTKMVAITHVSNILGTVNPIRDITKMAHAVGANVLVDGAQAAPHFAVDVQDLDADFYVFSGHKLYGPTGIGVLYGKASLLNSMPPYQGGGDMIETVTFAKTTYNSLPFKFEAGTPLIAEAMGLGASIDYLSSIGMENIAAYDAKLLDHATRQLEQIPGLRIVGTALEKGALISFTVEGVHPLDIGTLMDLQGIAIRTGHLCSQPLMQRYGVSSLSRASFAFYNTLSEIDLFACRLSEILKMLR